MSRLVSFFSAPLLSPELKQRYGHYLLVLLALCLLTAWTTQGYLHADEYFQTIEFASYKLGITKAESLPWEFHSRIRPWLQPGIYYLILKAFSFVGIADRFVQVLLLHFLSAFLSIATLLYFGTVAFRWFRTEQEQGWLMRVLCFTFFVPLLFVRNSSEVFSTACFMTAATILLRRLSPDRRTDDPGFKAWEMIVPGVLCGLAFEFRYSSAFLVLFFCLWLLWVARLRFLLLTTLALSSFLPILVCIRIDRWGYGDWVFAPWNYFASNILDKRMEHFGTSPFFAYLYLLIGNIGPHISLLLVVAIFLCWYRHPRHVVTWVTLPYFVFHSLLSHKEDRFMFPLLFLWLAAAVLAVATSQGRPVAWLSRVFQEKNRRYWNFVWYTNLAIVAFLALYPITVVPQLKMQRHLYHHHAGDTIYKFADYDPYIRKELFFSFYRPPRLRIEQLPDTAQLESIARGADRPLYVATLLPGLTEHSDYLRHHATPEFRSFLFCRESFAPVSRKLREFFPHHLCPVLYRIEPTNTGPTDR
ncbi:MAG TPA: hypothetical protein PKH10_06035 [bacterium]|nr:hypothetical protein [bacterium]